MQSQGFVEGKYNSSTCLHKATGHQSHGARRRFRVFRLALIAEVVQVPVGKKFEIETKVIGKGEGEVSVARVLSRILRVSTHGLGIRGRPETR